MEEDEKSMRKRRPSCRSGTAPAARASSRPRSRPRPLVGLRLFLSGLLIIPGGGGLELEVGGLDEVVGGLEDEVGGLEEVLGGGGLVDVLGFSSFSFSFVVLEDHFLV